MIYMKELYKSINKNCFKKLKVDRSKMYSVVIVTNSPDMVDFSKCEDIDELLVDEGNILNKLKK